MGYSYTQINVCTTLWANWKGTFAAKMRTKEEIPPKTSGNGLI
jgi:hypothetical protein